MEAMWELEGGSGGWIGSKNINFFMKQKLLCVHAANTDWFSECILMSYDPYYLLMFYFLSITHKFFSKNFYVLQYFGPSSDIKKMLSVQFQYFQDLTQ